MAFYLADPSIEKLFPIESDVKTVLRNCDIINLRRLSETTFPIDKETYVLACASGIIKFIELLEEREPKVLKIYNTNTHKCMSWTDAGLIAAIRNKRVKVVKKLMARKKTFDTLTSSRVTQVGLNSNDLEIMSLIDPCYQGTLHCNRHGFYNMMMNAVYITGDMTLLDKAAKVKGTIPLGYDLEYYRARHTGMYDMISAQVLLGLYGCEVSNILETKYIDPIQYKITVSCMCEELGVGGNIKTIRKVMEHQVIHVSIIPGLCENNDKNSVEILKEVIEHWTIHGKLLVRLKSAISDYNIPNLKFVKLLLEIYFQLPDHDPNIKFRVEPAFDQYLDDKKDIILFLINKGCINIRSEVKLLMNIYVRESGDEQMRVLLNKIPIKH